MDELAEMAARRHVHGHVYIGRIGRGLIPLVGLVGLVEKVGLVKKERPWE